MSSDTKKTMKQQQRHTERNKERCLEKGRRYYKEKKERLKSGL